MSVRQSYKAVMLSTSTHFKLLNPNGFNYITLNKLDAVYTILKENYTLLEEL